MSIDASLSIASWGLRATQAAIRVVGENVANADTAGYTAKTLPRQTVVADSVLSGVRTGEVRRNVDRFLQDETWSQLGRLQGLSTREAVLRNVEAAHGDPALGDSIGGLVGKLSDDFSALAVDPSDASRQAEIVQTAERLASRINDVSGAVKAARQDTQTRLREGVSTLNTNLKELARLNEQIRELTASGRSSAELEDKRDSAMTTIAGLTGAAFLRNPDGQMQPVGPGGLVIPVTEDADVFAVGDANLGTAAFYGTGGSVPPLTMTLPGTPNIQRDVTTRVQGGSIGALLELRDNTLALQQAELDELSQKLARRFEQQGLTLFVGSAGTVPNEADPALAATDPVQTNYLGFGAAIRVNDAVRSDPRLVRDGTHDVPGTLVGPVGSTFTANPPGGPEGFIDLINRIATYTFGTELQDGVPHDPAFQTSGLGGAGTLASDFSDPGTLASYATRLTASAVDARSSTTAAKQGIQASYELVSGRLADDSGVSVDAEMSQLVELQNSYSANARVITTVQAMWDALLAAVR